MVYLKKVAILDVCCKKQNQSKTTTTNCYFSRMSLSYKVFTVYANGCCLCNSTLYHWAIEERNMVCPDSKAFFFTTVEQKCTFYDSLTDFNGGKSDILCKYWQWSKLECIRPVFVQQNMARGSQALDWLAVLGFCGFSICFLFEERSWINWPSSLSVGEVCDKSAVCCLHGGCVCTPEVNTGAGLGGGMLLVWYLMLLFIMNMHRVLVGDIRAALEIQ